jgi:hypothetical protein
VVREQGRHEGSEHEGNPLGDDAGVTVPCKKSRSLKRKHVKSRTFKTTNLLQPTFTMLRRTPLTPIYGNKTVRKELD